MEREYNIRRLLVLNHSQGRRLSYWLDRIQPCRDYVVLGAQHEG